MEVSNEQPTPSMDQPATNTEQETTEDQPMEDTEDYNFEGDEYRPFIPRGRGGFR